ncbi:MAG: efflux RND transporter periplasmic adaptor subunit [Thermovirgaceae bacterium]
MKIKRKQIIYGLVLVVLVGGYMWYSGRPEGNDGQKAPTGETEAAIKVSAGKPVPMTFEDVESFVGTVEPEEEAKVISKVGSSVTALEVYVDVGDQVKKGQLLAKLDPSLNQRQIEETRATVAQARAAVAQAKSRLQMAERDYARYKGLFEEEVISRQEMDQIENRYEVEKAGLDLAKEQLRQAEAKLRQLEIMREYHNVVSPVEGVVAERFFDPGDTIAAAGGELFSISKQEGVKIKGTVTESVYSNIRLGQNAKVRVDALDDYRMEASVSRISPVLDEKTRTALVEVFLESEGKLKPGMFARVDLALGEYEGLGIEREAIKQLPGTGEWYCFVVTDGRAKQQFVKIGASSGNMVEIREGLNEGDLVISPVVRAIRDGVSVEVVR